MNPLPRLQSLLATLQAEVIGQPQLIERLLIAVLADGHVLLEGPPGIAKTRAARLLASMIAADFHRIQFTPDLLPADLTGSEIFRPQDGSFHFERGPLFHHLLLADEINRAPAKVQSALLEAMGERQITVGQTTFALPRLFLVIATQNPIEHEGTYPLPEAQLDRFLLHVRVGYPTPEHERDILRLARAEALDALETAPRDAPDAIVTQEEIFAARRAVLQLHLSPDLEGYIVELVAATRHPEAYGADLAQTVRFGASPRGTLALERAARARAWLLGRDYVSPDDIQAVAADALRHRVLLTWDAQANGMGVDELVTALLERVAVP